MQAKASLEYVHPTPRLSTIHMALLLTCSFSSFYTWFKGFWAKFCFSHRVWTTVTSRIKVKRSIKFKVGNRWRLRGQMGSIFLKGNYPTASAYPERSGPLKQITKTKSIHRNSGVFWYSPSPSPGQSCWCLNCTVSSHVIKVSGKSIAKPH